MSKCTAVKFLGVSLFFWASLMGSAHAQSPIPDGAFITLQNQYPGENGYLRVGSPVKDFAEFSMVKDATRLVTTSRNLDSSGATTWKIFRDHGGTGLEELRYGDRVFLENRTPSTGYLDTNFAVKDLPAYNNKPGVGYGAPGFALLGVFTTPKPNRGARDTSLWIITPPPGSTKKANDIVMAGDSITLLNAYKDALRPQNGGFLDTMGYVRDVPALKNMPNSGNWLNVFTTAKANRDKNSSVWKINISK